MTPGSFVVLLIVAQKEAFKKAGDILQTPRLWTFRLIVGFPTTPVKNASFSQLKEEFHVPKNVNILCEICDEIVSSIPRLTELNFGDHNVADYIGLGPII